ncbi:hypothetical protein [Bradyrhizobium sp. G127]|uniref:hypothetical protein n=1 Tax=Bradyrhizobium sp. G127 TaxID=2904800 RepID=UPI001F1DB51E|nr:hypothetical protein [Bradyrhizobium sp. G127]MCF2523626.1 hypothetical protein [Bradyrhizobium sp. G127]
MSSAILTKKAAAKMNALTAWTADLRAIANNASLRAAEMRASLAHAPSPPPPPHGSERPPGAMSVEAKELQAEIDRLQAHAGVQHAKAATAMQLIAHIEHWLTTLSPDVKLVDTPAVKLTLGDGETYMSAIGRVRQEIATLSSEHHAVHNSHPSMTEKLKLVERYVDGLDAKTKPRLKISRDAFELDFSVEGSFTPKANLAAAMVFLDRDRFLRKVIDMVEAHDAAQAQHRLVMTADARAERLVEIRTRLRELESIEEYLISEAAQDDVFLARRPTADPCAVLSVKIMKKETARTAAA